MKRWPAATGCFSAQAGPHRMIWDLHYQPLNVPAEYPISAVYANTAPTPTSPWVMPGTYTVKLTVNGKTYTQPLAVRMDPRVKPALPILQQQHDLAFRAYKGREKAMQAYNQVHLLRAAIASLLSRCQGAVAAALKTLDEKAAPLEGAPRRGGGRGAPGGGSAQLKAFAQLQADYATVFSILQEADEPPTTQSITALQATEQAAGLTAAAWMQLQQKDLPAINAQLKTAGLDLLKIQ